MKYPHPDSRTYSGINLVIIIETAEDKSRFSGILYSARDERVLPEIVPLCVILKLDSCWVGKRFSPCSEAHGTDLGTTVVISDQIINVGLRPLFLGIPDN